MAERSNRKRLANLGLVAVVGFLIASAFGCANPSYPTDLLLNLPPAPRDDTLVTERRALVVLQHGLWRSSGAMWRLERTLRGHGYDVLNPSYPSTRQSIQSHAARLSLEIEKYLEQKTEPYEEVHYIGHSMGGLVIRAYLATDAALPATSCVFLGTPQRGATLAEVHADKWWFRFLLGTEAARQLRPSDPFQAELASFGPVPAPRIGVIYGGKGDDEGWDERIPGDDDGTVGVAEAALPEATATKRLRTGHTRLCASKAMIEEVLLFLSDGIFSN